MSEARDEANRRWPVGWGHSIGDGTWRDGAINGFILGAEWARAEWEAEQGEGEHVFIERYGAHHAKFGGIGGDATSLTITREAWKSVGEPDVLAVSWMPVEQEGESNA